MHAVNLPALADPRRSARARIIGGSGFVAVLKAAQSGLMLLALALAARWLDADAYGRFATVLAWAGMLAVLAQAGLPQHMLRRVAAAECAGASSALRTVLRRSLGTVLLGGAGLLIAAALVLGTGASIGLAPDVFAFGAAAAAPLALMRVLGAWLQARGRVVAGQVADALVRPGALMLGMAIAGGLSVTPSWTTAGVLVVAAAGAAVLTAATQVWTSEVCRADDVAAPEPPIESMRAWLGATAPLLGVAVLHTVLANADVLMLGALAGDAAAGAYHAASRVALTLGLAMAAVGTVTGPQLARAAAAGETAEIRRIAVDSARVLAIPAALALPVVGLLAEPALAWLGNGFAAGAPALIGLWVGQLVNLACGPVAVLLNCHDRERAVLVGLALGAGANLALNALLIPPLGATGAAIASAVSTALWNGWLVVAVRRRIGVDPTVLGRPTRAVVA